MQLGNWQLLSVVNGSIALDGGAMFGVVPKVLWSRATDADEQNRIPLATRTLIAVDKSAGRVVLVDTGCGNKWPKEAADRFNIRYDEDAIPNALSSMRLTEADVTDVVVTHLHFDHNGGLTLWTDQPGGETKLRYPKANHWIHRDHLKHAQDPYPKDRASFLAEDFEAIVKSNLLRAVEGDSPDGPFDGLTWFVSHGHTPAQLHPVFAGKTESLLFVGDIIPTSLHLRPGWVMAYDVRPLLTIEEKAWAIDKCLKMGWMLAFPHDPSIPGARIEGTTNRPIVAEVLPLVQRHT